MTASHPLSGVRTRRKLCNITAANLAKYLSVHPNTYSRLERGERVISLPKAKTLAAILGCSVDDLEREPSLDEQIAYLRAQHATTNGPESAPESLSDGSSVVKTPPLAPHQPPADEDPALKRLLDELNDATGEPE
jgi:transcriptional regulator with XRE-family HTH domain